MKKMYETPSVEKICFNYRNQVVVASQNPGLHTCEYHHELLNDDEPDRCCTQKHWWTNDNTH